jgi:chromosome segregation ATPase
MTVSCMKRVLSTAFILLSATLSAASPNQNTQVRDLVFDLRYAVDNQQTELAQLRQRIENQESIIDTVREEAVKLQAMSRELMRSQKDVVGTKVATVEAGHDNLKQDVQALQAYANSVRDLLELYQSRLNGMEAAVEQQTKNLKSMETAVQALVDVLQPPEKAVVAAVDSGDVYRIVEGDSLERLARRHHTTIRKLKELNNLTTDRIIIGQKLKIPAPSDAQ